MAHERRTAPDLALFEEYTDVRAAPQPRLHASWPPLPVADPPPAASKVAPAFGFDSDLTEPGMATPMDDPPRRRDFRDDDARRSADDTGFGDEPPRGGLGASGSRGRADREDDTPGGGLTDPFVTSMQDAGLLTELQGERLTDALEDAARHQGPARWLDVLDAYYDRGSGDLARSARDRCFVHHASDNVSAAGVVATLTDLVAEIGAVKVERLGDGRGPLVLRAGAHVSAVFDDEDDDELDDGDTVAVRSLARSLNVLLERCNVRMRLVALRSDGEREAYFGTTVAEAMTLCQMGYLEHDEPEALLEFASW